MIAGLDAPVASFLLALYCLLISCILKAKCVNVRPYFECGGVCC